MMKGTESSGISILAVEDSRTQAVELEYILAGGGYRVSLAMDGEKGLATARAIRPDLVISDVLMPVMDGYEMCRKIKEDLSLTGVPVILLTSLTDPRDIIRGIEARADYYITKPYDGDHLLAKVAEVLQRRNPEVVRGGTEKLVFMANGHEQTIEADPQQILNLLISVYENALRQNRELLETQKKLRLLNEELEEKLNDIRNSEEHFAILVKTIPDIVYKVDPKGRFIFLNEAIREMGYAPEELFGKHFSTIIHDDEPAERGRERPGSHVPETGEAENPELFEAPGRERDFIRGKEVRLVRKCSEPPMAGPSGPVAPEPAIMEVNSSRLFEIASNKEQKVFVGSVGVIRDITERKKAEAELARLNNELVAREKLVILGRLVGNVNHELRNPLGVIANSVYFLGNHLKEADEKTKRHLHLLQRETENCANLIAGFLDIARLQPPGREEEDVTAILREAATAVELPPGVSLEIDAAPALPRVRVDREQIRRVFINLLTNGAQAMERGGKLSVVVSASPAEYRVTVRDTGAGIEPENLDRIFEPLFSTKVKGIGLGLTIVKEIVERHGGTIQAKSAPGRGTEMIVNLPLHRGE